MNEKDKTIRILHITEMLSAAGIESFIMNIYRNIDRKKVQFDFLVLRNQKEFYDDEIAELGGKKYFVHSTIGNAWLRVQDEARQIEKFLKNNSYKIVHIHYTTPLRAPYLLAAKRAGVITRIYHAHSAAISGKAKWKHIVYEYYRKKMEIWGTDWFACSEAAAEWIFPKSLLRKEKIKVICNGIDIERFRFNLTMRIQIRKQLGIENEYTLIHTGRFSEQKNQSFVIDVFVNLRKECPNAKLLFLGEGELLEKARKTVKNLGIEKDVFFLGVKDNVEDYLCAADCYIMPSLYEGLPVAVVEAECSGLPCVLSKNITKEVELSSNVSFISLDETIEKWEKQVLEYKGMQRIDRSGDIVKKGYNVKDVAEKMQRYYEER